MENIKIRDVATYYPESTKHISEYITEYEAMGKDIRFVVKEMLGKEIIHISKDNQENTLTMSVKVAKKILEKAGLTGKDIDMIVLSSMTPEYLSPPTSLYIHQAIEAREDTICYDMNANCIGMTFTMTQVWHQMQGDKNLNRVLIVGADYSRIHVKEDSELMVPNLGDGAAAIILEKTNEDSQLIDVDYYVDSSEVSGVKFPICGLSHMHEANREDLKTHGCVKSPEIQDAVKKIQGLLDKHNIGIDEITLCCFSQFAVYHSEYIKAVLDIPEEKVLFVGDKYGYTGTSSPFFVLDEAVRENKIKRGEYILFWTVATQWQHIVALVKY